MDTEPKKITQNIYARLESIKKKLSVLEKQFEYDIARYKRKFGDKHYEFKPGNMIECETNLFKAQNEILEVYRYANTLARKHDVYDWWDSRKEE